MLCGSCVQRVSNVYSCCTSATGSLSTLLLVINATALIYWVSAGSVFCSTGSGRHLGDWSISISLEDSSYELIICLVCTIFAGF